MIISTSRPLHTFEKRELTRIEKEADSDQNKNILFDNTNIAMRSAKIYYKVFRQLIDASNLDEGNNNTTHS